jgi:hypothetical protein
VSTSNAHIACNDVVVASRRCGQCGRESVLEVEAYSILPSWRLDPDFAVVTAAFECVYCNLLSVAHLSFDSREVILPRDTVEAVDRVFIENRNDVKWFPERFTNHDFPDVPDAIASVASEAYTCFDANAYRGAIILARAVIEATAKHQKIEGRTLEAKISGMAAAGMLTKHVVAAADAIRDSGNAVAHGDFAEYTIEVEEEEVSEVLDLMSLVLQEVFQSPAKSARVSSAAKTRRRPATTA